MVQKSRQFIETIKGKLSRSEFSSVDSSWQIWKFDWAPHWWDTYHWSIQQSNNSVKHFVEGSFGVEQHEGWKNQKALTTVLGTPWIKKHLSVELGWP